MEPAEEPLLRYMWRSVPRGWKVGVGLVLLGLAAWGISVPVDAWRRARLREAIRAYLEALPPVPPPPVVADEDNAAPALVDAMAAVQLGPSRAMFYAAGLESGATLDPEVVLLLEKNAEVFRLLEAALEKPGFAPAPPSPSFVPPPPVDAWNLQTLVRAKARVALRSGRTGEAVATALLMPRTARRIGSGRAPPWNLAFIHGSSGILDVLEAAVARENLDEAAAAAILRDLPSGEEARAAAVADFEATSVRELGSRFIELLGDDAEKKARAAGWRPPTAHERLLVLIGKAKLPPGVEPFPAVAWFRTTWEASTDHRSSVGLRGPEAVEKFGPVPTMVVDDVYVRVGAASFASAVRFQMGTEARLEVIRAAAALRLAEFRSGNPPSRLPEGTRDPYTGGPLLFHVEGEGWEVSSAGPGHSWSSAFPDRPVIRWIRTAPVPEDGRK